MGKLFKEAEKTKLVLSSNKESMTMIESLVGDYDFKGALRSGKGVFAFGVTCSSFDLSSLSCPLAALPSD